MNKYIDFVLRKLTELIAQNRFEDLESDTVEIKPVPPVGTEWKERYKSVNAFLNTRGGILLLGVKETNKDNVRKYEFTGYQEQAEPKLKELPKQFTDRYGKSIDLTDCFPSVEIRPFLDGRIAVVYVDELAADRKFCFYEGEAYKRILTGDHKIKEAELDEQEEYREEAVHARELQIVPDTTVNDLDIDKLNEYVQQINRTVKVETIKPDLNAATPFLERKSFIRKGEVTTLGMLVCGKHVGDLLGFRAQVHGYVDVPDEIARDKHDLCDNILPLMEGSLGYILRNIQVGVSIAQGGSSKPQYPEELLRETVNNALAHRDYSNNKQIIISIKPGDFISIQNPGTFRKHLLLDTQKEPHILRIIPEARPRNPKLADVLRVYRKWEGKGIGMATLVNLCLQNKIDLPYYRLYQDEVKLFLCNGKLLDERMERLFASLDSYIENRMKGASLTETQKLVLSYLIKSEEFNKLMRHTILLSPDNNHYNELILLEQNGLIHKHPEGHPLYPIYLADNVLIKNDYVNELNDLFGLKLMSSLDETSRKVMNVVFRFNTYSKSKTASAKQASFYLWAQDGNKEDDIKGFDTFYRKIRYVFNKLEKSEYLVKDENSRRYRLNSNYRETHLG